MGPIVLVDLHIRRSKLPSKTDISSDKENIPTDVEKNEEKKEDCEETRYAFVEFENQASLSLKNYILFEFYKFLGIC